MEFKETQTDDGEGDEDKPYNNTNAPAVFIIE